MKIDIHTDILHWQETPEFSPFGKCLSLAIIKKRISLSIQCRKLFVHKPITYYDIIVLSPVANDL